MKIAILNKKGGVGKTPFAFSIAKDLGMYLQSNDNSCIEQIYPRKAMILEEVQDLDDCVYDFGGYTASGVIDIIKHCNCIIVPCMASYNSLLRTLETIQEIANFNNNIFILATGYKDEKEKIFLKNKLEEQFPNLPIFYFKNSKIVNNAINSGMSFLELYKENALSKQSYSNFIAKYKNLLDTIKKYKG